MNLRGISDKSAHALVLVLVLLMAVPPGTFGQPAGPPVFKQEELDQMLAPIALYPDSLLAQIFMASTYPLEVVQADRWAKQNTTLKGDALTAALEKQPWDPSVKSLVNFPQVLTMMSEKLDWTQKLGDAFLAQQKEVMATVQTLRKKAVDAGNLKTTSEQQVIVEKETIVIQSASPQVVYVPTYNPTVVYGAWPYPAYPPAPYYPPGYVGRDGSARLRSRGGGWSRLGVCVGRLQLARRRCGCRYQPKHQYQQQHQPRQLCEAVSGRPGELAAQPRASQGGFVPGPGYGTEVQPGIDERCRPVQGKFPGTRRNRPAGYCPRRR